MPTKPTFDSISLDALTSVTGGCGGKKKCCCPPPAPQPAQAQPQLPPSDDVSVSVNYQG
jgi:hypothetical protein